MHVAPLAPLVTSAIKTERASVVPGSAGISVMCAPSPTATSCRDAHVSEGKIEKLPLNEASMDGLVKGLHPRSKHYSGEI